MKHIFCFLFLMGISGTQGQESSCPESALDCPSICACRKEKKNLNTVQTDRWNKECHECDDPGYNNPNPMLLTPLCPKCNAKNDIERNEKK